MTAVRASFEDGVGRIVIDQPPLNILTRQLLAQLRQELDTLSSARELRALLITAEGEHFSAGADVGEHLPPEHERMIPEFVATVGAIDAFPLPVIAVVRGRCLGGGFEVALAADLIVAAEGALFGQPEIMLGVLPPAACALLPERCPPGVAAELVLTGDPIEAGDAERVGLVRYVVPDERLESAASELAARIARHSAATLRVAKRALRSGATERRAAALAECGKVYVDDLMKTRDAVEGLQAFIEKRKPSWSHR